MRGGVVRGRPMAACWANARILVLPKLKTGVWFKLHQRYVVEIPEADLRSCLSSQLSVMISRSQISASRKVSLRSWITQVEFRREIVMHAAIGSCDSKT